MDKTTVVARTPFGTFTRTSARTYTHCVVRKDGWHQFSQTAAAAQREYAYQVRRGREVVVVETEPEADPATFALSAATMAHGGQPVGCYRCNDAGCLKCAPVNAAGLLVAAS